jgi:acyl-CoA synthetase (AMP-forming)/AMP-acid ligase II
VGGIGYRARTTPQSPALLTAEATVTFTELDERHRRLAGLLREGGLERGARVGLLAGNRPELIEVAAGCLRAGIVPVPVSPLLPPSDIAHLIEDSGAEWLFSDRPVGPLPGLRRTILFGNEYERRLQEAVAAGVAEVTLTRPMHYTSGTTGRPKGVWVPPKDEAAAARASDDFRAMWGLSADDVHLVCSPLSHSAPLRWAIRTLEAGGAVAVQERFDAEQSLAAIALFGVTTTFMVPTHLERIFGLQDHTLRRHDLGSIRLVAHAGAPMRETTKRKAIALFPPGVVWEFYGSTEGQATRISAEEWLRKPGSVGIPRAEASILITEPGGGEPVAAGETGEVWVCDPTADRFEYWGDEARTRAAWQDGCYSVGDLGWLDRDGYLFLAGRIDDMIITGGINVHPQEVEAVLSAHPAVTEAMVYGAPHEEWGQQVRALVVPAQAASVDPQDLRAWARERLAGPKVPRAVEIVDELPRTSTGKLRRRGLGR